MKIRTFAYKQIIIKKSWDAINMCIANFQILKNESTAPHVQRVFVS
jgi:hypothetical protein